MEEESEMAEETWIWTLDMDSDLKMTKWMTWSSDEEILQMEDEDEEMDMEDVEDMLGMDLPGDELEVDDEEEVLLPLDLTGASDEEILKVFKAMGEEDGIIISQDEVTKFHLKITKLTLNIKSKWNLKKKIDLEMGRNGRRNARR